MEYRNIFFNNESFGPAGGEDAVGVEDAGAALREVAAALPLPLFFLLMNRVRIWSEDRKKWRFGAAVWH